MAMTNGANWRSGVILYSAVRQQGDDFEPEKKMGVFIVRPDRTATVDWALKTNDLSL